ncbi:DoxX family membrane protein [candidate division KSB1 bacterium]|nr:DoxX family membrane protein [candidate division KSB1 bacterium]
MVEASKKLSAPSGMQLSLLVLLRVLIGWHFLYEGLVKLANPYWTSAAYLAESQGIFAGIFKSIVANPLALQIVDFLNIWGLIAIGLALILGFLGTIASFAGAFLILLYYLANPPFIGFTYSMPSEGSYLIVNKNLIEFAALLVLAFYPTSKLVGVDRLIFKA